MAFNPIERLRNGDVDFLYSFTDTDKQILLCQIRGNEEKNEVIRRFIHLVMDDLPYFCFDIIYDNEEFAKELEYLLSRYIKYKDIEKFKLRDMVFKTRVGKEYIKEKFDLVSKDNKAVLDFIFEFIFSDLDNNMDLVKLFYLNPDLHIRFLFMKYIIVHYPELIEVIYDDFTKYLTSYTYEDGEQLIIWGPDLMNEEDISELAVAVLDSSLDRKIWEKLKKYILDNYQENSIAHKLLEKIPVQIDECSITFESNPLFVEEFKKEADKLYMTSSDYKFMIFAHYVECLSEKIREDCEAFFGCFAKPNTKAKWQFEIDRVYSYHLGNKLEEYVDKYLSMSNSKVTRFIGNGSCAYVYQIGDYVFKFIQKKWSTQKIICPRSYLILRNLEEDYVRNKDGSVLAGLEVQPFLTRKASDVPVGTEEFFHKELAKQGYYVADTLLDGSCGDNCMLLDSYLDADCDKPEELPDEFKDYPMVLIDHDTVFKLGDQPLLRKIKPY